MFLLCFFDRLSDANWRQPLLQHQRVISESEYGDDDDSGLDGGGAAGPGLRAWPGGGSKLIMLSVAGGRHKIIKVGYRINKVLRSKTPS